jgi:hypothetical protein
LNTKKKKKKRKKNKKKKEKKRVIVGCSFSFVRGRREVVVSW